MTLSSCGSRKAAVTRPYRARSNPMMSYRVRSPSPGSPRTASRGRATWCSSREPVGLLRSPRSSSAGPRRTPGLWRLTRNRVMSRRPSSGTRPRMSARSATGALVMWSFSPVRRHPSGVRSAVVRVRATSDPPCGSVRAVAPTAPFIRDGRMVRWWNSLPCSTRARTSPAWAIRERTNPRSSPSRAMSAMCSARSRQVPPAPPRCSGTPIRHRPSSARRCQDRRSRISAS